MTPEVIKNLLAYCPRTGRLFWRYRDGMAGSWNTRFAGKEAFTSVDGGGYRSGRIFNKTYRAHRVIWAMQTGAWPEDEVDHINGDRADNRWSNLREATHSQNLKNRKLHLSSPVGVTGIGRKRGKWRARITHNGIQIHIGTYHRIEDAISARLEMSAKLHGEFSRASNG